MPEPRPDRDEHFQALATLQERALALSVEIGKPELVHIVEVSYENTIGTRLPFGQPSSCQSQLPDFRLFDASTPR
jgi:hypothetical protein